jgi:hypothetical protein
MRRLALICVFALLGTALAAPPGAGAPIPAIPGDARCSASSLRSAATEIFGAGTEIVARQTIAGLPGALVLEPRIAPGTRARLLRVGTSWCEASTGFNLAWAAAGRSFDGAGAEAGARAYARIAAAPYFDGVTVTSIEQTAPGIHTLTTHALTNGVDARWAIVVDADGIRTATWTATEFAQRPLEAQTEGLTAMPGGTETYTRTAQGLLAATRGLPTAESAREGAAPSLAEYHSPDDFVVAVSVGDSHVAIDPDMDTGVRKADVVRENLKAIEINYEEFHEWGLRKGWGELEPVSGPDKGYVYINDALSFYCFACVFIADDFQIHMLSEVEVILNALGYSYPEGFEAYQNIIGHEMFHNFQNRYNKPGPLGRSAGRGVTSAYSEGTARAQESMHSYSKVSYQENSLIYATDGNGCNGYKGQSMDVAMSTGTFNKGYSGCFFWLSWFAAEGTDGLVQLVSKAYPKVSPEEDGAVEGVAALGLASKLSVPEQAARFAGAAITGRGYAIGGRDWGKMLDRWTPPELATGDYADATLSTGGIFARRLTSAAEVSLKKGTDATLFAVIDTGTKTLTEVAKGGRLCLAPKPGQKIWVGAVRTKKEPGTASIVASKPSCN